jgi:acyl-CoA thioesterase I
MSSESGVRLILCDFRRRRKSQRISLTPIFALLLLVAGCGRPAAPPPHAPLDATPSVPPRLTIVAFGDSITAGKDLDDPDAEAYPAVLERILRARGRDVRVVNAGVSGNTTFDALERLDFSVPSADLVIVQLGANDTFQGKSIEAIEKNLAEIVTRLKKKGAAVVLWDMKTFPNLGPFYAEKFERIFARVAKSTGCTLAPFPLEGVAGNPAMNLADGMHPNAGGHERVAANLVVSVETVLSERL